MIGHIIIYTIPSSHVLPYTPTSHPYGQPPSTSLQGSPLLQLPQDSLHVTPYAPALHPDGQLPSS